MRTKQVIVMRTDLNMRKGKMCAQAAHASMAFITRRFDVFVESDLEEYSEGAVLLSRREIDWLNNFFTKICLGIDSEEALLDLHQAALNSGLVSHVVQDNGTTEFGGVPTYTCLALGPDDAERIDQLTGSLRLL